MCRPCAGKREMTGHMLDVHQATHYARSMSDSFSLAGKFLLSLPGMEDPRFSRSVIALCLHDGDGAFGVDTAQPHDGVSMETVLEQVLDRPASLSGELLLGGPVEPNRGFLLHDRTEIPEDSVEIPGESHDGWCLSASATTISRLADGDGPESWLFALGYSGWASGQLEDELTRNGWLVADLSFVELARVPALERWDWAYRAMGISPGSLAAGFGQG